MAEKKEEKGMYIEDNIQEVKVGNIEVMIVPTKHFDCRLKKRGIEYQVVMDAVYKHAEKIYSSMNYGEVAVIYDAEKNYSFGLQKYATEFILTTPVDSKMRASREQKIFLIERKNNSFELISFEEYRKFNMVRK